MGNDVGDREAKSLLVSSSLLLPLPGQYQPLVLRVRTVVLI